MRIHAARAGQQLFEMPPADRQRDRQADRRPQREAAADPVPELEDVLGGDAEFPGGVAVGRQRDEVAGHCVRVTGGSDQPVAGGAGVGQGFERGEGLAGDDEQGRARVEAGEQRGDVGAVDIGDEMHLDVRLLPGGEGLDRHARPEVGAADADVDDVGDALAGIAAPAAAVDAVAEALQAPQHRAHFGRRLVAGAQGHVADGAPFAVVDRLAGQHAGLPAVEVGGGRRLAQQGERFAADALLGKVEQQAVVAQREILEALRVGGEQVAQMLRAQRFGVRRQGPPGGRVGKFHSQIIRPGSNLWVSAGCDGKMRIWYSSLPHSSGVRSMVYSISPLPVGPSLFSG